MTNIRTYARRFRLALALVLGFALSIGAVQAADTVTYYHTDALGTPVMESNAAGTVTYAREHKPYGEQALGAAKNGPGFTGHVGDTDTGLTYMQARYFDPAASRFLSNDPVAADMGAGGNYNRYWYANNNPYRFTDPDGRRSKEEHDHKQEEEESRRERKEKRDRARNSDMVISRSSRGATGSWANGGATGSWASSSPPMEGVEGFYPEADLIPLLKGLKLASLGTMIFRLGAKSELVIAEHALRRFGAVEGKMISEAIAKHIAERGAPAVGETIQQTILVGGREYSFRAFGLSGGRVSVGTAVEGRFARNVAEP